MKEVDSPQAFDHENAAEAQLLFFRDKTEYWRILRRERFDEQNRALFLKPMTKEGERHDVVWLERSWPDTNTGETAVFHQAVCKCIVESEYQGDPEMRAMYGCEAWNAGVVTRAIDINREDKIDLGQMLGLSVNLNEGQHDGLSLGDIGLDPVDEALMFQLRRVKKQPSHWSGNIMGGEHELPLLSVITGYDLAELSDHAYSLSEKGWINFSGEQTIRLAA